MICLNRSGHHCSASPLESAPPYTDLYDLVTELDRVGALTPDAVCRQAAGQYFLTRYMETQVSADMAHLLADLDLYTEIRCLVPYTSCGELGDPIQY